MTTEMKNEITRVGHVPFMGTYLMAAQDAEGNIWAGIAYICNGIGLNKSQKHTQIQNVQHDEVLKEGCLKFQAGYLTLIMQPLRFVLTLFPSGWRKSTLHLPCSWHERCSHKRTAQPTCTLQSSEQISK